jgi:hypothetical protein|tara:strand:+ start:4839 stop:5348 length:510 start_codon:yes stop_codon:yes gene_type:complete
MIKRIHKNKSNFGMKDYYNFYDNNYEPYNVTRLIYNKIITDFNKELRKLIINQNLIYKIPYLYFEIMLKKEKRVPRIVNGKLINNVPIDWQKTNKLWAQDEEAKEKKLLVRYNNSHTSGYIFRIYCKKFNSKVKNKNLFKFQPNREFKRELSKRIKDTNQDNLNAYLLY